MATFSMPSSPHEGAEMSPVKVSVVMSTYNGDNLRFFQQAIKSVLEQTHNHLELIIVADGELSSAAMNYLSTLKDARVHTIFLENNQGPAIARNTGIRFASGEYIAIMDADDICRTDRIEKQLAFLQEEQVDLVGSSYYEIDDTDRIIGEKKMPNTERAIKMSCPFFNPINNPTVLARASILKGNAYPEKFRLGEDYRLWIHLLREGFSISNHMENLLYFRRGVVFFTKRRGLGWAMSDLRNKLYARHLVDWHLRPIVVIFALITFLLRLLPPTLNRWIYKMRRQMAPKN